VQSSLHEAQGMAVLEAAACGVPCAGTATGALCDLAPEAARTTAPDAHALAQAIVELAVDKAQRRELGRAARAKVESCYNIDACVQRFVLCYQNVNEAP